MLETVLKRDRDLGTPARTAQRLVSLTIDGQAISVPEGTSVMRAAAEAGINIPKLCATDSWKRSAPAGSAWCRSRAGAAIPRRARPPSKTAWWS